MVEPEQVSTSERLNELFASYPLHRGQVVWLVGGCEGLQIKFFLETYPGIKFHVFEPQALYVEYLKNKYMGEKVHVHPYALGDVEGQFIVGLRDTECTFHWKHLMDAGLITQPTETLQMEDVAEEYFWSDDDDRPDFLMMNCEGSELEIIKRLSEKGYLKDIPYVLTQFHSRVLGFEGCQEAYDILTKTHDIKWRYGNWAWVYAEVRDN